MRNFAMYIKGQLITTFTASNWSEAKSIANGIMVQRGEFYAPNTKAFVLEYAN